MVLLTFFGSGEYGFSNVGVGAILGNGHGIQVQNYVILLQGSEMTVRFHYRNWILCICFRLTREFAIVSREGVMITFSMLI